MNSKRSSTTNSTPFNANGLAKFSKLTACDLLSMALFAALLALPQPAGAQTATWNGTAYDLNWSTAGNWTAAGGGSAPPAAGDTVIFGNGPYPAATNIAGSVDNIVTTNTPIGGLTYNNQTSTLGWVHTTQINAGVTLTVNGPFNLGLTGQACNDTMTGTGNFTVNNITGNFNVGGGGISTATCTLTLADGTNTITVKTLSMSESGSNNGRPCTMNLGAGPTFINADSINLGTGKGQGTTIQWLNPAFTNFLVVRDHTGTGRAGMTNGWGFSASGAPNANWNLANHHVDILAGTLLMGKSSGSDTATSQAHITYDNGILDATSIIMGDIAIAGNTGSTSQQVNPSVLNVGGNPTNTATLIVNSPSGPGGGVFLIGDSYTNHTANCTLNLNQNANAQIYCSMVKAQSTFPANNIVAVNIEGGTLNMEAAANTIGTPSFPVDQLVLSNATLQLYENGSALNAATAVLTLAATNVFNFGALPIISSLPTIIPIISYTSWSSTDSDPRNLVLGSLPGGYTGYLTNTTINSVLLVITNGAIVTKADQWGGSANNNWDTTSLNWTNAGTVVKYAEGDFVTFDDQGRTNNVNVASTHTPASLTFSNSILNYTLSGTGAISGASSLVKYGAASTTLAGSGGDNFAGGIFVHAGTLVLDNSNANLAGGLTNDANTVVQIGNNDNKGALPVGAVQITGTLVFNQNANKTVSSVISGSGGLTQSGVNSLSLNAAETYTGTTTVNSGTLALGVTGSLASALTVVKNSTLDITLASSAALSAVSLTNGTFNVGAGTNAPNITALSTTNSTINVTANYANVGGTAIITAPSLTSGGPTNLINVSTIENLPLSPAVPFSIPIISYTTLSGGFNFGWNGLPGIGGYISNNVVNKSVDLVVVSAPVNLTWNGGSATDNNWSDAANWTGTAIVPLDALVFDGSMRLNNTNDTTTGTTYQGATFTGSAGLFSLNGNSINLSGTMINNSPSVQTVNLGLAQSTDCTLDGGTSLGSLAINGGITNTLTNGVTVTLQNVGTLNDFWQSTNGGRLEIQVANNLSDWTILDGTGSGALVQAGNVELHVNAAGTSQMDYGTAGSAPNVDLGFTNAGLIQIDGTTAGTFNMNNGTLRANSMRAGGNGTQFSFLNVNGGLILLGGGSFSAGTGAGASGLTITITNGALISTNGATFTLTQRSAASVTQSGGLLQCNSFVPTTGQTIGGNGIYNLNGGIFSCTNISIGSAGNNAWGTINFNGGKLRLGGSSTTFFKQNNLAILTNSVQVGGAIIDTAGFSTALNLPLVSDPTTDPNQGGTPPDGGLTKLGAGTLTLSSANTYNGITAVGGGTLLVHGSILNTSGVTVSNNATLGGNGTIGASVTVNAGGTLSPGASVGILTVNGNVTLGGTNVMEIDKVVGTNDLLRATSTNATTIAYGGTLNVVINGTVVGTDTFKLFSATNYSGSFATIIPATPGGGLGWNTNTLTTDGTLRVVVTVNTTPTNITAVVSGNQLNLSWPADHTGWRLQGQTNSAGRGLTNAWSDVPGSTSVHSMGFTINPANGSVFYRLIYP